MERKDSSSSDLQDGDHDKGRGGANKDSSTSDRSSAEASQRQLSDKQATQVPDELKVKIRAMLLETL